MQHWWKNWQRKPTHSPVLTHRPAKLPRTVSMGTECFRPVSVKNDDFCCVFMWWGKQTLRAHLGKCTPEIEHVNESEKQASSHTHYFWLLFFQTLQIIKIDNLFFLFKKINKSMFGGSTCHQQSFIRCFGFVLKYQGTAAAPHPHPVAIIFFKSTLFTVRTSPGTDL